MQRKSFYNNLYLKSTHLKLTSHSFESFQIGHQKNFWGRLEKRHNTFDLLYSPQNDINHNAMDKRIPFFHVHILIPFVFFHLFHILSPLYFSVPHILYSI